MTLPCAGAETQRLPALCCSPCPDSTLGTRQTKAADSIAPRNKCRAQDLPLSPGPGKVTCHLQGAAEKKVGSTRIAREGGVEVAGVDFMPLCLVGTWGRVIKMLTCLYLPPADSPVPGSDLLSVEGRLGGRTLGGPLPTVAIGLSYPGCIHRPSKPSHLGSVQKPYRGKSPSHER